MLLFYSYLHVRPGGHCLKALVFSCKVEEKKLRLPRKSSVLIVVCKDVGFPPRGVISFCKMFIFVINPRVCLAVGQVANVCLVVVDVYVL